MGGASKLISSLLLTSSPLRLRPSPAAFALFLSPPGAASRRQLLHSPPLPLRTLSNTAAAAASSLLHSSTSASATPPPHAPFPEWSRLVDRLAAAGYASRAPYPADELAPASGCDVSAEAEAAVSSCLAFARDRPDLLRSLPRKDVEVVVANAAPALFKDAEASVQRLRQYLAGEDINVIQSERAETVDIVRYLLSYVYSSSDNYSIDKELTDSAVRNILAELVSSSGLSQTSTFVESTAGQNSWSQHERFSRPRGQNIEMKRGDWICTRCSFMNFARNARCLECNEHRPKKMLTGGEWECPQCEFYNYGRNMSCLRCDCKRPGKLPPNPASFGTGLGGVAQLLNVSNVGKSEIERKLAENDEKAERWLSKVSQSDDSADLSSLAADEDFPEIMPMRKGVNKFVVGTHKTPLERRLANAQCSSNNSPQTSSSDSKISQTLDMILGRSSSSAPNNQSGNGGVNAGAPKKSTGHLGDIDPVPFLPLSADLFAKPGNTNNSGQTDKDAQINTEAVTSTVDSSVSSTEDRGDKKSLDTTEKWSKKVAELDNANDLSSAISDEDFPEIMPVRKGENRFVISKKKDRPLTSPQYKRRSFLEQADDSNFVPFVPFPPGYFAQKDKPVETAPDTGIVPGGFPSAEKLPETNASFGNLGNNQNTSQVMGSQENSNMSNKSWNRNYSQQNFSTGGYAYGESNNYQHQPQSHEVSGQSSDTSNNGPWNTNYSQGSFNESRGGSTGNGSSCGNNTWSSNGSYDNNDAWSNNNNNNNWSGSYSDKSSASGGSASANPHQTAGYSSYGESSNSCYAGKSLEGSAVKDPDPLDMSEEAKAERWFRRASQIKDISELANIPDEDFPKIMPMRKGGEQIRCEQEEDTAGEEINVVSVQKEPTNRKF